MASAAVLAVEMSGHENASAAVLVGTFTTKTGDLAVLVNLVGKGGEGRENGGTKMSINAMVIINNEEEHAQNDE